MAFGKTFDNKSLIRHLLIIRIFTRPTDSPGLMKISSNTITKMSNKTFAFLSLISYQDYVAEMLEGDCVVHHAPWAGDGGSLDTRYILQCLPLLLSSSVYEPVQYDAIIFNAGLHDVDCCNFSNEVNKV